LSKIFLEACLETEGVGFESFYEVTTERDTGFLVDAGFIYSYTSLMAVMLKKMFNEVLCTSDKNM
jgi:hypothetical protein